MVNISSVILLASPDTRLSYVGVRYWNQLLQISRLQLLSLMRLYRGYERKVN